MLRQEQNDLVTQTGPGTAMGRLFRCYWIPVLLADELPENDCPPVRVKLLSERLIAFRDSRGAYGLIDEFCRPPRRRRCGSAATRSAACAAPITAGSSTSPASASRCRPSPRRAASPRKIKLRSYPLVERGGVLWTYMGPPDRQPPLPEWEFALVPAGSASSPSGCRSATGCRRMEGGIDSSHVSFLHRGDINSDPLFKGAQGQQLQPQRRAAGVRGGREPRRPVHRRPPQRRERQLLLADHAMGDAVVHDDRAARRPHRARPLLDSDRRRELLGLELRLPSHARAHRRRSARRCAAGKGMHVPICSGDLPAARQQGQRLPDGPRRAEARRQLQRRSTASRCRTPRCRKAWVRSSIAPRRTSSRPTTASSWRAIGCCARSRRWSTKGTMPPGVDVAHQRVRSAAVVLPPDQPFKDAAKEALTVRPGIAPATV